MSFCIKIYARQCPPCLPSTAYDAEGRVCLDTFPTERYSKSKTVTELSEFGKLKSSTVRQFSLPATARNKAILKSYGSVTALNFDNFTLVPVTVFEGSSVAQEIYLSINKKQNTFDRWTVSLTSGGEEWIDGIGNCYLCDIPNLGLFELTKENIRDTWLADSDNSNPVSGALYQDGDDGIVWPLIHYGGWTVPAVYDEDTGEIISPTYTTAPDFRPWIYLLKILQEGFCKLGYKLKAPIFETEWGRRLIIYALDDVTSLQNEKEILNVGFTPPTAVTVTDQNFIAFNNNFQTVFAWLIPFANESAPFFDAAASIGEGYYNTTNNCVENIAGIYCFEVCMDIVSTNPGGEDIVIWLTVDDPSVGGTEAIPSTFIKINEGLNENVCFTFENVKINMGDIVKLSVQFPSLETTFNFPVVNGGSLSVVQKSITYQEGIILDIASLLDCTCTLEDILAGALHLIGKGKIQTDHLSRTVCIYPPETIKTPRSRGGSEITEGYFLPKTQAIDMRDKIIKNSECVTISKEGRNRFLRLCFNDNDDYLESQGFGDGNKPYSSTNDLGDDNGFVNDTDDDCNPTFDATGTIIADDINLTNDESNSIEIPALWDNTDNEISWDLGKRILVYQGYTSQRGLPDPQDDNVGFNFWSCESTPGGLISTQTEAPIAYHESEYEYWFGNTNDLSVTYADNDSFSQLNFYERELLNLLRGLMSEYLFLLNNCDYRDIDFRKAFYFEYAGKPLYFWPSQIKDFRSCENIPTPVIGYPENKQLVICPKINLPPYCSRSAFAVEGDACEYLTFSNGAFVSQIFTSNGVIQGSQVDLIFPDLCVRLNNMLGGLWTNQSEGFFNYLHYQGPVVVQQIVLAIPLINGEVFEIIIPMEQAECP